MKHPVTRVAKKKITFLPTQQLQLAGAEARTGRRTILLDGMSRS